MTFIEASAFFIVILFMIGNAYFLFRFVGRDLALSQRHTIRYQNYQQKEKWFYLTPHPISLQGSLFFIMAGTLLILVYMFTDYIRIYTVILTPLVLITLFFYFNEKAIEKTQFPLQKFDRYYQDIHTLIEEKTNMLQSITTLNSQLSEKEKQYQSMLATLNPWLIEKVNAQFYHPYTNPIHDTLDTYQKDLLKYDNSITGKFNDLLISYLKHQKMTGVLSVPSLITFSIPEIEKNIEETTPSVQQKLILQSIRWIEEKNIASHQAAINLIDYVDQTNPFPEKHIALTFEYFDQSQKTELWVNYLVKKKWINGPFLLQSNYLNLYPWIFQENTFSLLPKDQTLEILKYVVEKDLYPTAMSMMLKLPGDYQSIPERFVRFTKVTNASFDLVSLFSTLYSQTIHFTDPSTLEMNRAYALENYYQSTSSNTPSSLATLFASKNYLEESENIRKYYKQHYQELQPTKVNALEMMMSIQGQLKKIDPLFKFETSLQYLNDLQKTLSIDFIHHFLFALILITDYQIPTLLSSPSIERFCSGSFKYFNLGVNFKKPETLIAAIKKFYTKKSNRQALSAVLYQIEKDRLLLTKLLDKTHA
jgi:hypothetical protein